MDQHLGALTDQHRRAVVRTLAKDGAVDREELVRNVAAEGDSPDAARVALYHRHLPKLEDAGVIAWDSEESKVARGEKFEKSCRLLSAIEEAEPPQPAQ